MDIHSDSAWDSWRAVHKVVNPEKKDQKITNNAAMTPFAFYNVLYFIN